MTRSTTNSTTKSTKSNASATFDASRAREREKLHAEIVGSIPVASGGFGLASQPKTSRRRDGIAAESRSISAATTGAGTMGVLGGVRACILQARDTTGRELNFGLEIERGSKRDPRSFAVNALGQSRARTKTHDDAFQRDFPATVAL